MPPGPFTPDPLGNVWPIPFPWLSFGFSGPVPGFSLVTTTPSAEEPISLSEAKAQVRVTYTDEDLLFSIWIAAARRMVETEAATALVNRTLTLALPCWPLDGQLRLPVGPVSAVNSVKYYDAGGTLQTLADGADYQTWLAYRPPTIFPAPQKFWPVVQFGRVPAVSVEFVAGHGTAADVPETAKVAILMTLAFWAENRGDADAPGKFGLPDPVIRLIDLHLSEKGYR